MENVLLGVLDLLEAKRLSSALESRGIKLLLVNNPETCSKPKQGPVVEVYAPEGDIETVKQFLAEERAKLLEGHDLDGVSHDHVFDTEKPTATCPACGTEFPTSSAECPECGLGFAHE